MRHRHGKLLIGREVAEETVKLGVKKPRWRITKSLTASACSHAKIKTGKKVGVAYNDKYVLDTMAQMVAHQTMFLAVAGSSPARGTKANTPLKSQV